MGEERVRFGFVAALIVSVVLHLVLVAVVWMMPSRARTEEVVVEKPKVRFDLTAVQPTPRLIEPKRQAPFRSSTRSQDARPPSDPAPAGPSSSPPPPSPAVEQPETEIEEEERDGADVPGSAVDPEDEAESTRPAGTTPQQQRRLDVEGALRDFNRTLRRPPSESDGSGKGLNIPDLPPFPATGFGFGNLEFESRDFDWSDYARQIYMAIWRAWHNRLYVTADEFERWAYEGRSWVLNHQNRVTFTIEGNGQVTGIAIETPSGCYPLDDSAVDALTEVILPPLPSDFPRSRETVHARFIADSPDVRTMRGYLKYLKDAGYF